MKAKDVLTKPHLYVGLDVNIIFQTGKEERTLCASLEAVLMMVHYRWSAAISVCIVGELTALSREYCLSASV